MGIERLARCMICGRAITYRFGRPRKACDSPACQQALQRLRARRFKLKKKRIKGEAAYRLKQISIEFYEPTFTNADLGNLLNIGGEIDVIPSYAGLRFIGLKPPDPLTVEFVKDSALFLQRHPEMVKYPSYIRGRERTHRIGPGELYLACNLCYSTKLAWTGQGWYCTGCGNESDFSLPII
ncbi:MAG: hypothetical protein QW390_02580 [Candidatus Bathyarchaeia archaeon]